MLDEKKIREQYNTEIKNMVLQRDYLLKKIEVLDKFQKTCVRTDDDVKELKSLLCYNDLCYCCKPKGYGDGGKNCMWRSAVLKLLGIPEDEFVRIKEKMNDELMALAKL